MIKIFGILLIIFCASHFGTTEIFAQKTLEPEESIFVEFVAPTEFFRLVKFEVPIGRSFKERRGSGGGVASGSAAGCSHCSEEYLERISKKRQTERDKQTYSCYAEAWHVNKKSVKLKLRIAVRGGDCKTEKTLKINKNMKNNVRLGCNLVVSIYPNFEN